MFGSKRIDFANFDVINLAHPMMYKKGRGIIIRAEFDIVPIRNNSENKKKRAKLSARSSSDEDIDNEE